MHCMSRCSYCETSLGYCYNIALQSSHISPLCVLAKSQQFVVIIQN